MHAEMWRERLRDEPRFREAVEELWPYALGLVEPEQRAALAARFELARGRGGRARRRTPTSWPALWDEMTDGAPLGPGGGMVTAERGLGGARRGRGPGDPGDLARRPRRRPRRPGRGRPRARRVHADVPRLPGARGDARPDDGRDRGAGRRGRRRGRPRRLLVDRQDHAGGPREAPRRRLRPARPARGDGPEARPAPEPAFRCPYCGSTDTKLENIFGPTPCRSIRYCSSCRQPFEQFKTI